MTDLTNKTVEELRDYIGVVSQFDSLPIYAFDELARRLEEAQQKIVAQQAMFGEFVTHCGVHSLECTWVKSGINMKDECDCYLSKACDLSAFATSDAEVAKALEELAKKADGAGTAAWLLSEAAEYRAKAVKPARHEHEAGAPLTADCDNWCKFKHEKWLLAKAGRKE